MEQQTENIKSINCDQNPQKLRKLLDRSLAVINEFNWLLNSYVLDYYVKNHWTTLPLSWRHTFEQINPEDLCTLFTTKQIDPIIWPLSLLCTRALLKELNISRDSSNILKNQIDLPQTSVYAHPKLKSVFSKHVKPKKRHEVKLMSELCAQTARECDVHYIVDFGAGLGHLSRILGYGYGLNVTCLEQDNRLTTQATFIDRQLEKAAVKCLSRDEILSFRQPKHINLRLTKETSVEDFFQVILNSFNISKDMEDNFQFGIVALHPCGDLAPIILNIFLNCDKAKFLNIVGCCYMKLSCNKFDFNGYPLSSYLRKKSMSDLGYEAREIACHAQEMYIKHLENKNYDYLKVHSYRAAIEKIIIKYWPNLKHAGLKSIKHKNELTFFDYCKQAVTPLQITIPNEDIMSDDIQNDLNQWKQVVIFYTLRLLLASLVETVLLYDRLLYTIEKGCSAELVPIFDPILSPRNHILTAKKGTPKI